MRVIVIGGAFALLCSVASPAAAGVVRNGGFERGSFAGWELFGDFADTGVAAGGFEGGFHAFFGNPGTTGGIRQTVRTQPGHDYLISIAIRNDGDAPNAFSFDVFSPDLSVQYSLGGEDIPVLPYAIYEEVLTASGEELVVSITARHDSARWYVDAVDLVDLTPVPAPAGLALFGLVAAALIARRRR